MAIDNTNRVTLKQLLARDQALVVPGSFDMVSARLIEMAGFEAVFVPGYSHTASALGMPDAGLTTFTEMLERVHHGANCVNIPVVADADTGYGNAINVRRTVREYEWAGAQGIQLEDQEMPKKCGHTPGRRVIPAEEMALKLEAALEARRSDDFQIIARIDSASILGIDDAIARGKLYEKVGADVIFVESPRTVEDMKRAAGSFERPTMANMVEGGKTPLMSTQELEDMGYKLLAYPLTLLMASIKTMQDALSSWREKGSTKHLIGQITSFDELDELMGFPEVRQWEARYSLKQQAGPAAD